MHVNFNFQTMPFLSTFEMAFLSTLHALHQLELTISIVASPEFETSDFFVTYYSAPVTSNNVSLSALQSNMPYFVTFEAGLLRAVK